MTLWLRRLLRAPSGRWLAIRCTRRAFSNEMKPHNEGTDAYYFSSNQYFEMRSNQIESFERSSPAYPHHFPISMTLREYRKKYESLEPGEKAATEERIAGRVFSKREASSKLVFYDIRSDDSQVQVMCSKSHYVTGPAPISSDADPFATINKLIHRGDVIGVRGIPGKSQKGELSIFPRELTLLAPCLRPIPPKGSQHFSHAELRYRQRYLEMIAHPEVVSILALRTRIIKFVRDYLDQRGFLEVETPILQTMAGGASACPFETTLHALDNIRLYLRIAPELYLKRLVIGGIDRVYEIGKSFRNEGIDTRHNPEFTTCEFYMAYADYNQLMDMTEDMLSLMARTIREAGHLPSPPSTPELPPVDFTLTPYRRVRFVDAIAERLAAIGAPKLPSEINSPEVVPYLLEVCNAAGVAAKPPHTIGRLLDSLFSKLVEPQLSKDPRPVFVIDHPRALSPLAKSHRELGDGFTERFEMFASGFELVNAYTELNDPRDQRRRFAEQMRDRNAGDIEAQPADEDFCKSLEYGLPPTAGWGMGIDRLAMVLAGVASIREVLWFPTMKPK